MTYIYEYYLVGSEEDEATQNDDVSRLIQSPGTLHPRFSIPTHLAADSFQFHVRNRTRRNTPQPLPHFLQLQAPQNPLNIGHIHAELRRRWHLRRWRDRWRWSKPFEAQKLVSNDIQRVQLLPELFPDGESKEGGEAIGGGVVVDGA